jgi:hypothetical protein
MRKRHLLSGIAAMLCGMPPAAAMAQDGALPQTLGVIGSAPQVCDLQQGQVRAGNLLNFSGTEGNVLRVQQFVDPATLSVLAARAEVQFQAVCNYAHRVRLESPHNGLWPTDGRIAQQGNAFAYAVPYDATVSWAETSGRLTADAKVNRIVTRSLAVDAAYAGDLVLRIDIARGASNVELNAPVMAGDYADTLRIFLEPR